MCFLSPVPLPSSCHPEVSLLLEGPSNGFFMVTNGLLPYMGSCGATHVPLQMLSVAGAGNALDSVAEAAEGICDSFCRHV